MNEHDKSNLQFLLNASDEVLADWYHQQTVDDINYAMEILQSYREMLIEHELDDHDFTEAQNIIEKIRKTV